tara:strand:+ start:169 stop:615 length:447 start_codon:yes stop_codon:yes gene_type:complete
LPVRCLTTSRVYGAAYSIEIDIEIETLPRRDLEQKWIAEEIEEYVRFSAMITHEIEVEEERQFVEAMHALGAHASHVAYMWPIPTRGKGLRVRRCTDECTGVDPARVNELDEYEDRFMAQVHAHEYEEMENQILDDSWVDDLPDCWHT